MSRTSKFFLVLIGLALVLSAFPPLQGQAKGLEAGAQAVECETYHRVRRGETLYRIGVRYGVSWPEIAEANDLRNPNRIFAGQYLCIPGEAEEPEERPGRIPTFVIASVDRNQTVTIQAADFPADTTFVVRMGRYGTLGVRGIAVATFDSEEGGSFLATFQIPEELKGRNRIAIRLESTRGYYSYNWFYNRTTR